MRIKSALEPHPSRKSLRSLFIAVTAVWLFSILLGGSAARELRKHQFEQAISSVLESTQHEQSVSGLSNYARLLYSLVRSMSSLSGVTDTTHGLNVAFCRNSQILAQVPNWNENSPPHCQGESHFWDREFLLRFGIPQLEDDVRVEFRISTQWTDALTLLLSGSLGIIGTIGLLFWLRRSFERWQIQSLFQRFERLLQAEQADIASTSPLIGWSSHSAAVVESQIVALKERMTLLQLEAARAQTDAAIGKLASQVAHDIRSPLAALAVAETDLGSAPEDTRLMIRSAIGRIRDIANHLIAKNRLPLSSITSANTDATSEEIPSLQFLSSLVDSIISEKRLQFRSKINIQIEAHTEETSYGLFAHVQPIEFKRVLSNLINNAVEAIPEQGRVKVGIKGSHVGIELRVQDNGNGIPPELFTKLMQRGQTFGKAEGTGLGLYHAKVSVERWGGKLNLESKIGEGTSAVISLPRAQAPEWFVENLLIKNGMHIAVLDDDDSIHQIWKGRFESLRLADTGIKLHNFSTPEGLMRWHVSLTDSDVPILHLVDYEFLGYAENGLDLIESLAIEHQSILVTSRFDEASIRDSCISLKIPIIPKSMAGFIPITVTDSRQ